MLGGSHVRQPAAQVALLELWSEPKDIADRDLLRGASREAEAPSKSEVYTVMALDKTGFSRGYDVKGPDGREWDIKVGKEVQPEIVLSRILWALGYHQPQTYYVTGWQLAGILGIRGRAGALPPQSDHESEGEWAWRENPFAGTRPLQGLVADQPPAEQLTTSKRATTASIACAMPKRSRSVDTSFRISAPRSESRADFPYVRGTRNDIDDYEDLNLIRSAQWLRVQLDYRGSHADILERLSAADVIWACELMNRLSDAQLDDAFKAAGYPPDIRAALHREAAQQDSRRSRAAHAQQARLGD